MRLFHISDLHLGKTLRGYELIEDQAYILESIVAKIGAARPEALIIAGDVYDRSVPPVEAVRLLDGFLRAALEAAPGLRILLIPGNHDSAGRLSFGSSLMADKGLRIAARVETAPALVIGEGGEKTAFWALPFLTQSSAPWGEWAARQGRKEAEQEEAEKTKREIKEEIKTHAASSAGRSGGGPGAGAEGSGVDEGDGEGGRALRAASLRSQQELMRLALEAIRPAMDPGMSHVLTAHCFASGAFAGDSETAFVGAAEQVDSALFRGFDYVALGHLHSVQSPAPHIWYSGAPLAYSAGEADQEKALLSVELRAGAAPRVERVPLTPKRRLRRLSGYFADLTANPLPESERGDYIEARILDEEPVLGAWDRLKALYPRLLGAPQRAYEQRWGEAGEAAAASLEELRRARAPGGALGRIDAVKAEFEAFHREMTGEEPSAEMLSLFESIAREAADAAD